MQKLMLSFVVIGVSTLLSVVGWVSGSASAQPLAEDVLSQGETREAAEKDAYAQAIRQATSQHYGLAPDNPITRHLLTLPLSAQRSLFDPPGGVIAPVGSGYRGRQTFEAREEAFIQAIRQAVSEAASQTGLTNISFALTASVAPTVSNLTPNQQIGMTSALNDMLGSLMVSMGLPGSQPPTTVRQTLEDIARRSKPEELANLYQTALPRLLEEIRLAEDAPMAGLVFGNFNVFEVQPRGEGFTVLWELRGAFFDLRGRSVDEAVAQPFAIAQRRSSGNSLEAALRIAYATAADALVTANLLQAVTRNLQEQAALIVRLCGIADLDDKLAAKAMLVAVSGTGRVSANSDSSRFSITGAPVSSAVELYAALKPRLTTMKWAGDLSPAGDLLIGRPARCQEGG